MKTQIEERGMETARVIRDHLNNLAQMMGSDTVGAILPRVTFWIGMTLEAVKQGGTYPNMTDFQFDLYDAITQGSEQDILPTSEELSVYRGGERIPAIKVHRERTGVSLIVSKRLFDGMVMQEELLKISGLEAKVRIATEALEKIEDFEPGDIGEHHACCPAPGRSALAGEWGEAACYHQVQRIAAETLKALKTP